MTKLPGVGKTKSPLPSAQNINKAAPTAGVELPDIVEGNPRDARPAILVRGVSGAGKTTLAAHLLRGGLNGLVLDIESKSQQLLRYRPMVMPIAAPVENKKTGAKRPPTDAERYARMQLFLERLEAGDYRMWNGKPIDLIIGDGLMEYARLSLRHWEVNAPLGQGGGRDMRAGYGLMGKELTEYIAKAKYAASAAAATFGHPPVGMFWTVGEKRVVTVDELTKQVTIEYLPVLPGNVFPDNMAFLFEQVYRLRVDKVGTRARYIASTVGSEADGWQAKAPDLFGEGDIDVTSDPGQPKKDGETDFADVYNALTRWYQNTDTETTETTS